MTKRILFLLLTTVLACAAQKPERIPVEYQGNWSADPAYCHVEGDTLDNELYLSADTVGFHSELHRVKSVKLSKGKVALRYFRLSDATRKAPKVLVLSDDKSMLNGVWHRCPDTPQEQEAR